MQDLCSDCPTPPFRNGAVVGRRRYVLGFVSTETQVEDGVDDVAFASMQYDTSTLSILLEQIATDGVCERMSFDAGLEGMVLHDPTMLERPASHN